MTGVEVVTASSGDQDAVVGILRAATAAGAGARASTWGREFPDVVRDLPDGLVISPGSRAGRRDVRAALVR